jgi:hypothetical protein
MFYIWQCHGVAERVMERKQGEWAVGEKVGSSGGRSDLALA